MSSSRITDEACVEALEATSTWGSMRQAAHALGLTPDAVRHRVNQAYARGLDVDPSVRTAMDDLGMNYEPNLLWVKTKGDDKTPGYSAQMVKKKHVPSSEVTMEEIREMFANTPPVELPDPPLHANDGHEKTFALINLNDLHFNALAWAEETGGEDWDTKIAEKRLMAWTMHLIAKIPLVSEVILHFNGDTFHTNGRDPFTPKSQHVLDADTRYSRAVHMLSTTVIRIGDIVAQIFPHVRFVVRPGNHDRDSVHALQQALFWRYRETENVVVDIDPGDYWVYRRGKVMIASHHGDKAPWQRLVNYFNDRWREEVGKSRYNYLWTAHGHRKERDRVGAWACEMANALCEQDAHASEEAYPSDPAMEAIVYHEDRGEVGRDRVASWLVPPD